MSSVRHEIVFLPDEADEKRSRVECLVERMTKVMLWMTTMVKTKKMKNSQFDMTGSLTNLAK